MWMGRAYTIQSSACRQVRLPALAAQVLAVVDQVIDDAAARVAHHSVERLPVDELRDAWRAFSLRTSPLAVSIGNEEDIATF